MDALSFSAIIVYLSCHLGGVVTFHESSLNIAVCGVEVVYISHLGGGYYEAILRRPCLRHGDGGEMTVLGPILSKRLIRFSGRKALEEALVWFILDSASLESVALTLLAFQKTGKSIYPPIIARWFFASFEVMYTSGVYCDGGMGPHKPAEKLTGSVRVYDRDDSVVGSISLDDSTLTPRLIARRPGRPPVKKTVIYKTPDLEDEETFEGDPDFDPFITDFLRCAFCPPNCAEEAAAGEAVVDEAAAEEAAAEEAAIVKGE